MEGEPLERLLPRHEQTGHAQESERPVPGIPAQMLDEVGRLVLGQPTGRCFGQEVAGQMRGHEGLPVIGVGHPVPERPGNSSR